MNSVSEKLSHYVQIVDDFWPGLDSLCPFCQNPLISSNKSNKSLVIALSACQHRMHLTCLNAILNHQSQSNQVFIKIYIYNVGLGLTKFIGLGAFYEFPIFIFKTL